MRHAAFCMMHRGAAQRIKIHVFMRHGADNLRTGDEHVSVLFRHKDEIRDPGRIHRAAGARPQDDRYLRDYPAGLRVTEKYLAVGSQRINAFLDPRAARVI